VIRGVIPEERRVFPEEWRGFLEASGVFPVERSVFPEAGGFLQVERRVFLEAGGGLPGRRGGLREERRGFAEIRGGFLVMRPDSPVIRRVLRVMRGTAAVSRRGLGVIRGAAVEIRGFGLERRRIAPAAGSGPSRSLCTLWFYQSGRRSAYAADAPCGAIRTGCAAGVHLRSSVAKSNDEG
jgi:hypothetical protein